MQPADTVVRAHSDYSELLRRVKEVGLPNRRPVMLTEADGRARRGLVRVFARHQASLFSQLLLGAVALKLASLRVLLRAECGVQSTLLGSSGQALRPLRTVGRA